MGDAVVGQPSKSLQHLFNMIVNSYPREWRWLAVDIYRAAKRQGKYPPLVTDTEGDNCFSICPISEWIWKISDLNALK